VTSEKQNKQIIVQLHLGFTFFIKKEFISLITIDLCYKSNFLSQMPNFFDSNSDYEDEVASLRSLSCKAALLALTGYFIGLGLTPIQN
jgi:hypothetical protein